VQSVIEEQLTSRTQAQFGQILLCRGCCCGQTERGFPSVPVDRIKALWKSEKLNRSVQLTISGCLGPCDVPNVVLVLTAAGPQWFANISDDLVYDALVEWARGCHTAQGALPLPEELNAYRLERFNALKVSCPDTANCATVGQTSD
jgi:hypothetical protein